MAMSMAEAKYIACIIAVQEALWLRHFLCGIDVISEDWLAPMNIDSTSVILMVTRPKFSSRSKHIEIKYHFVCEKTENGEVKTPYLPSKELIIHALTKLLPTEEFARHVMRIGLKYI